MPISELFTSLWISWSPTTLSLSGRELVERKGHVSGHCFRLGPGPAQMTERPVSWLRHTRGTQGDDGALCRAKQTTAGLWTHLDGSFCCVSTRNLQQAQLSRPTLSAWSMIANKPNYASPVSTRVFPITATSLHFLTIFQTTRVQVHFNKQLFSN